MNKFEQFNHGNKIDRNILTQKEDVLRELFNNSKNPLDVILQEINNDEIKDVVEVSLLNKIKNDLNNLKFNSEDEFVSKIIQVAKPIWEITQKDRKDIYKQPNREMFSVDDVDAIVKSIKEANAQKIYVVGNVGSGKSTLARELAEETNYKNIDLDHFFQIYRQEKSKEASLGDLLDFVLEREVPPYIINHANLLNHELDRKADMIVLLNPKKDELFKSRELRERAGTEGEWRNVKVSDYDKIAKENLGKITKVKGRTVYRNDNSGTLVKLLKK